jgi:hypothetical protein
MGRKRRPTDDSARSEKPETKQFSMDRGIVPIISLPDAGFMDLINSLENMSKIKNDTDDEIDFVGETKDQFIYFMRQGYPKIQHMMESIYETGEFLTLVKKILKPKKLFLTWLNYAGFPISTAYNYMKLHDRYQEDLPRYHCLGVRKLLAVARLKDCRDYLNEHSVEIASKPSSEVTKDIKEQLKKKKKRKGGGHKRLYEEFGKYKIRWSGNGSRVVIENLTKSEQQQIINDIKLLLSKDEKHVVAKVPS